MHIGIDIDEVLADTIKQVIAFHNQHYQTNLTKDDFFSYDFWNVWGGSRKEAIEKVHEFFETSFFAKILPLTGAPQGVVQLAQDHKLTAISSRPTIIQDQTNQWIHRHFSDVFHNILLTNQFALSGSSMTKSQVCIQHQVDLLIDDSLSNATDCINNNIPVLLFDAPWNREAPETPLLKRVYCWKDICTIIENKCLCGRQDSNLRRR